MITVGAVGGATGGAEPTVGAGAGNRDTEGGCGLTVLVDKESEGRIEIDLVEGLGTRVVGTPGFGTDGRPGKGGNRPASGPGGVGATVCPGAIRSNSARVSPLVTGPNEDSGDTGGNTTC